jgi:hypothetical protein
MNTKDTKYQEAKEKVEAIKGFYIHLIVYVVVNLMLFVIDMVLSPDVTWFFWPLAGWGIAIVLHAVRVFAGTLGADWEEKKIADLMSKE